MIISNTIVSFCVHSTGTLNSSSFPLVENVIKNQYSLSFLVNAADNKQRDKNMSCIKVTIDV